MTSFLCCQGAERKDNAKTRLSYIFQLAKATYNDDFNQLCQTSRCGRIKYNSGSGYSSKSWYYFPSEGAKLYAPASLSPA